MSFFILGFRVTVFCPSYSRSIVKRIYFYDLLSVLISPEVIVKLKIKESRLFVMLIEWK